MQEVDVELSVLLLCTMCGSQAHVTLTVPGKLCSAHGERCVAVDTNQGAARVWAQSHLAPLLRVLRMEYTT